MPFKPFHIVSWFRWKKVSCSILFDPLLLYPPTHLFYLCWKYQLFIHFFLSSCYQDTSKGVVGEEQGQSNVMCRICFSGENEGSEKARRMLPCKTCGKKYHRNCLKTWSQHRGTNSSQAFVGGYRSDILMYWNFFADLFHWSSWACPSCRICEVNEWFAVLIHVITCIFYSSSYITFSVCQYYLLLLVYESNVSILHAHPMVCFLVSSWYAFVYMYVSFSFPILIIALLYCNCHNPKYL